MVDEWEQGSLPLSLSSSLFFNKVVCYHCVYVYDLYVWVWACACHGVHVRSSVGNSSGINFVFPAQVLGFELGSSCLAASPLACSAMALSPFIYFISMQNLLCIFLAAEDVVADTIPSLGQWRLHSCKKSGQFTNSDIQRICCCKRKELWASWRCWSPQRVGHNVSGLTITFEQRPEERKKGKTPVHKMKIKEKAHSWFSKQRSEGHAGSSRSGYLIRRGMLGRFGEG